MKTWVIVGACFGVFLGFFALRYIDSSKVDQCEVANVMATNDLIYKMCGLELTDEKQSWFDLQVLTASSRDSSLFAQCYKSAMDDNKQILLAINNGRESLRLSYCAKLRNNGENFFKPSTRQ